MEGKNGPEMDSSFFNKIKDRVFNNNHQQGNSSFKTDFVNSTVEKTPFETTPAQNFFGKWCEINDSITPQFISRKEWKQRGILGILEKNDQQKQTLFLPSDLHLWEMMDVIKTVDHDTLANNPEKRDDRADKIKGLGKTFEKAGLYLSEYSPDFKKNNDGSNQTIQDVAREFYQYGLSLQHKDQKINEIPKDSKLSLEDKTKIDEWFLGKDIYQKRISRLGKNPTEEQLEETRVTVLQTYFKALSREGYKADGEKPWETKIGPFQHLQNRTTEQITKAIETPETEMKTAIYRRGIEKLVTEMKSYVLSEQTRLYDVLGIDEFKQELEEVKNTNDIAQISAKELEIAKKIQKAVSSFPYKEFGNNPSEMIKNRFINCVGSAVLGGGLLDKVGIKYLHVSLSEHSVTGLITSDKKVYWQDFTPGANKNVNYNEITSDMLEENIDLNNLVNIPDSGINIVFKNWKINGKQLRVNLYNPEIGLQSDILNNTGNALSDLGRNEEAIEAHKQAININPKDVYPYNGLGNALSNLGRYEEAIEAYKQAININPKYAYPYNGLGNVLIHFGRSEEAIEVYKQAIIVDPKEATPYNGLGNALSNLGRSEEALEVYKQAININPKDVYSYNGLGNALSDLGRNEEAIEAYKQAIIVDPKEALPYYRLGNSLSDLGRNEEAIEAFETFIKLWKGNEHHLNRVKKEIKKLKQK